MGRFEVDFPTDTRTVGNLQFVFDVYPNPSNNLLFLNFYYKNGGFGKLHSLNGKLIEQFVVEPGFQNIQIPVSDLPSGIYFISITTFDGAVATRKVIID